MTSKKETLITGVTILIATFIYAAGFNWCMAPNHITTGGITGIAQIIHFYVPALPIGMTAIVLNIPLFLIGWRVLGGRFLVGSLFGMLSISLMVDAVAMLFRFFSLPSIEDPLLASLYGGVVVGVGMGLLLRRGITTGGTDLGARLLKLRFAHLPIGQLCLVLDGTVVLLYSLAFRNLDRALYSAMALYVASLVIDRVVYSGDRAPIVFIISDRYKPIANSLLELDRGVTLLHGEGAYSGNGKEVLFCVCKRNQIALVKQIVHRTDPLAFMVVSDAHEVLGEGFNPYRENGV